MKENPQREKEPVFVQTLKEMSSELRQIKGQLDRLERKFGSVLENYEIQSNPDVTKWEVIWSRNEPFIVYRSYKVFKVYKVKVEDEFFIIEPIIDSDRKKTYQKERIMGNP